MFSTFRNRLPVVVRSTLRLTTLQISQSRNLIVLPASIGQNLSSAKFLLTAQRYKSKGKKAGKKIESESEDEEDDFNVAQDEEILDNKTKVIAAKVNSLRCDTILKSGLGMSRNKIETLFYESMLRINGEKVLKKSETVDVGDEIDIIKGFDLNNPKLLTVARVEILDAIQHGEGFKVKLRRCKSLLIENYKNPWKGDVSN